VAALGPRVGRRRLARRRRAGRRRSAADVARRYLRAAAPRGGGGLTRRALALVTARELRAYAPAWVAALVAAFLPWLAPLMPGLGHQPAADVRLGTAVTIAVLLALAFALFAGAGLLARDLGEGRISF